MGNRNEFKHSPANLSGGKLERDIGSKRVQLCVSIDSWEARAL